MAGNIFNQPTLVGNPFEVGTTTQPKNQTSIVSNVLNRNSDVGRLLSQTDIFKKPSEEELLRVKKEYDNATSWSNYLIGSQQLINKMASDGLLSHVLPDELQQDAAYAYRDNQREVEKVKDYRTRLGMSNADLSASEIAPELAVELGLLIPVAGQVGAGLKAIGAIDKLSKLGRAGKVIEEATKWGLAEAPVSALLGHQDEMGQRMAMSALGAGAIEGVIQGVGHLAGKVRGSDALKTKESVISGADDVAPVVSPEIRPSSTTKTLDNDFASTVSHADTNSEFMKKINSGKFDKWSNEYATNVFESKISKLDDVLSQTKKGSVDADVLQNQINIAKKIHEEARAVADKFGFDTKKLDSIKSSIDEGDNVLNGLKEHIRKNQEYDRTHDFYSDAKHGNFLDDILPKIKNIGFRQDIQRLFDEAANSDLGASIKLSEYAAKYKSPIYKEILDRAEKARLYRDEKLKIEPLESPTINNIEKPIDDIAQVNKIENNAISDLNKGINQEATKGVEAIASKAESGVDDLSNIGQSRIKETNQNINKIVSEGIDRISGFVVDSAKNLYANPNIKSFIEHGLDLAKIAKDTMSELANKNKFTKALKNSFAMPDESIGSFMQNLNVLVDKSMKAKMFVQLAKLTAKGEKTSIEVGNSIRSYIKQMMSDIPEAKELREAFTKHYLYTDFQSIKDLGIKTMSDARKYIADNRAVYDKFKKEIDQGAKALKDRGEMNSKYYYDNAYAIAKSKKVDDPKTIDTIDKLISVKSLVEKDLAFINRYSHENWFGEMSDMAHSFANESKNIFKSNPYHQVKGYYKEVYGKDLYSHDFDIDGIDHKSLKIFDRAEYTKGALPVNPNKRSIGSKIADLAELKSQDENVVNAAKERIESFDGRLRTVRSSTGEVLSWNRVLPESRRINELNKNLDSADILASSYQSLYKKRGVEEAVNFLKSDKDGVLLEYVDNGKYPKSGYVPLSEKDLLIIDKRLLPEEGKTLYVPQNFKHMMIGNEAIGFTEAKSFQNSFMNIMKDATDHFKHSVIIANARAYLVNYVGSYTAALRAGMKHSEIMSSFREANSLYKTMRQDLNEFYIKSTTGRSTASVEARLKANPLFQMKDSGLSLTMVHDYMAHTGSRSLSHDLAETGLQKLYKFLGKENENPLKYKDILGLEDGTKGGEIASLVMARFDVYGRYAIVKKALSSGRSIDEAVNEANSIFGDSNMITPRIIQALDSVPALPFANWMFKVFSGNVEAIKENFTQSLGIYLMFKSLSALTGYNLNSGDSNQIPLSPIQAMDRYDVSKQIENVNPAHPLPYMDQAGKLFEEGNPLGVLFSKNQ